ncbi:MAG TPA: polymer-forming cytoskeletal protein [Methylomirabilota bacterium]|jgi:cytoskeletal protein CcmA (bactofilin family)|nr:polymer-forming cytoskeletal protein [Methylomirabilota bacterium]
MRGLLRLLGLSDGANGDGGPFARATASVIGPGLMLKGELHGEGALVVLGRFEGELVLDGVLHIGPEARVEANVSAYAIVVAGAMLGNLSAQTRVEILSTGSLTGTVKSASFTAAEGATVKGDVWVERPADTTEPRA